ncbi:MAG: polysaccharide biosynthesis C-terminal domain-containing protein [Lachnospiraceae bacterium]|nr:polysaccharide biosynthesis C-terminal domain-containing protein [Lachnospiraceae bacterium]
MNKQYKKLSVNVAAITIGNFSSKILSFLIVPIYTAVLTTQEYGIVDTLSTTISLLYPFFTLLVSEAVLRFALDKNADQKQIFSIGFWITIFGFLAALLVSPVYFLFDGLQGYYVYFILYYFATTLQMVLNYFIRGIERVKLFAFNGFLVTFVYLLLNIVFLLVLKIGVHGYFLALIISSFAGCAFTWIVARLHHYLICPWRMDRTLIGQMLRYSVPMIPNSISWWISTSADKYILIFFHGYALAGVYATSQKIPSLFAMIGTIFLNAWQISAVEDFGSEKSRLFYSDIYRKYSSLNIVVVSAFICGTQLLSRILFASEYYEGWIYTPVLLFSFVFHALAGFLGTIYTSAKETKFLFGSAVAAAVVNIALNFMLIPGLGAMGAAWATLISYFVMWLVRLLDSRRFIRLDIHLKKDVVSDVLILVQMGLLYLQTIPAYIGVFGVFFLLVFLHREIVVEVLHLVTDRLHLMRGDAE